ncbi:MAG: NAD(P)-dependent oxidoreductase [Prolixibacteraceae bacterium]|nr:NAD(P)-dependent oxidoreductase [Prolixibacteraceae bacterium]
MPKIIIIGADCFIGYHLKEYLLTMSDVQLSLAVYDKSYADKRCKVYFCDILNPETLQGVATKDAIVINLVYLWGGSRDMNIQAIDNLLRECESAGIRRFIHISTAFVAGRAANDVINEATDCRPISEYEHNKLDIENYILAYHGEFEKIIVRPTVVFGPEGKNLLKMTDNLLFGKRWINYLRSCLFKCRTMNIVSIAVVIEAIQFLIRMERNLDGEIFIVSDDEHPHNTYSHVESLVMQYLDYRKYPIPVFGLPVFLTKKMLLLSGKSNTNPQRKFDCGKLAAYGFFKRTTLDDEICKYMEWFKKKFCGNKCG